MANKILRMLNSFFELEEEEEKQENNPTEDSATERTTEQPIQLSEVIDFIRELEAYYTNDIFKHKSSFINNAVSDDEAKFLKKKIQEYESAVTLITGIKEKLLEKERSCGDLWGKTSYSFYSELESARLNNVFNEAFDIVKKTTTINVIPELDSIIVKRLEKYRESWKIGNDVEIPQNTSVRIVGRKGNVETYQFGNFQKDIVDTEQEMLLPEQIRAIRELVVNVKFQRPALDYVWIRCATVERQQLENLKKTTVFQNDWESGMLEEMVYDIVHSSDVEYYIRAILQLLLPRKPYVIISILNPNDDILTKIKDFIEVDTNNQKVKVIDKMAFMLPERTGGYGDNLQFEYISRKHCLKNLSFQSFGDFIRNFLKLYS